MSPTAFSLDRVASSEGASAAGAKSDHPCRVLGGRVSLRCSGHFTRVGFWSEVKSCRGAKIEGGQANEQRKKKKPPPANACRTPSYSASTRPFLVPPSTARLNITTKVQPRIDNPAKKPRIHHPSVPLDPKPLTEPPQSGGIHTPESRSFPGKISAPRRRLRPLFPELVLFPVDCVHTRPP